MTDEQLVPEASTAKVIINDVEVGELTIGKYEYILGRALKNPANYFSYLFNTVGYALKLFYGLFCVSALVLLGIFILIGLTEPSLLARAFVLMSTMGVDELAQNIRSFFDAILKFSMVATLFSLVIAAGFKIPIFGIQNPFSQQIARCIRQELSVPAMGNLIIEMPKSYSFENKKLERIFRIIH